MRVRKREGDGATPAGAWRVRCVLYRADRVRHPRTALAIQAMRPDDGWCDAPADRNYNRLVKHPYPASAERLWRADGLYDVLVVLDYNERPRVRGGGSAIFVHVARPDYAPTEGCIALARRHLERLLERLGRRTALSVAGLPRKKRPKLALRASRARPGTRRAQRSGAARWSAGEPQTVSNCKRARRDRRDRDLLAHDRFRV